MKNKNAVIILDGNFPKENLLKNILKNKPFVICADGSANKLIKTKTKPDIIIGDMDSIEPAVMVKYIKKGVPVMKIFDQETTDFEKCLLYCRENNFTDISILGALGDRTDHSLNVFSVLLRHYRSVNITLFDNYFKIFFITKPVTLHCKAGEVISLLPFPIAKNITTEGVLYPLKNENLSLGKREGTLNFAVKKTVKIKFGSGDLILFVKHFL